MVSEKLEAGKKIKILANLIKKSGEIEEDIKEITCILDSDVNPSKGQLVQANFKCTLDGLNEPYYSLKLNNSDDIASIPFDNEIALDPVLTAEAISNGKLLDYSLEENQKQDNIPANFDTEIIMEDTCKTDGKFIIKGKLSKDIIFDLNFELPFVYPENSKSVCVMAKKEAGENQIQCQIDRKLENDEIVIEQTIIKDGLKEVFILKSISTKNGITCSNGLLLEADKKINVNLSFRQVSHFVENGEDGFSFFFAAFTKKQLSIGYSIDIKTIILVNDVQTEKLGKCTLKNDVSPINNEPVQADFNCDFILDKDEYNNINFSDPESIKFSPNNKDINGIPDLENDESSPLATDKAISKSKEAHNKNEDLPDLDVTLDYSLDENKLIIS